MFEFSPPSCREEGCRAFYRQLHKKNFDGPISLHIEYEKKASVEEHMRFLARDRKALAAALARR